MGDSKITYESYMSNIEYWIEKGVQLPLWASELSDMGFKGVCAVDFYDDVFGEDLEEHRMPEDYRTGEYGGIAIERLFYKDEDGETKTKGRRVMVTKGCLELYDLIDKSEKFCMIAPMSYAGKKRSNENTRFMYALVIEIDDIQPQGGINELIYSWDRSVYPMPKPTYIVCSGSGVHLYFVFERPVPMFRNIFEQMSEAKKYLTPLFWNRYITKSYEPNKIQYESINQPFRCVGTRTKDDNAYTMAFKVGKKITIEYINDFLPEDLKMNVIYRSDLPLKKAKELYPEWYQRRVVEKKDRGHWNRNEGIYYNWIAKIKSGAVVGHRYSCLENLCSLGVQCQIPPEQVEHDCRELAEIFEKMTNDDSNHFTEYDVICALRTYHNATEQAYRRKLEYITAKTGIPLERAKRNGRKRAEHLVVMNAMKSVKKQIGESVAEGRPSAEKKVKAWRAEHPHGRKEECHRDTGMSRDTIRKWWDA